MSSKKRNKPKVKQISKSAASEFEEVYESFDVIIEKQTLSSKLKNIFSKHQKLFKRSAIALGSLAALSGLYLFLIYTEIPVIANLRTTYIETAMSTMRHQWLATAFIPQSVIDEVMEEVQRQFEKNMIKESRLPVHPVQVEPKQTETEQNKFTALFPEVDMNTLPATIIEEQLATLQVKDIVKQGIKTTAGDPIWAIDVPNKLLIVEVSGEGYKGKLAIIKDSSQVFLSHNTLSGRGQSVTEQCKANNAVLGINASGFQDDNGNGMGDIPVGLVKSEESVINPAINGQYQIVGYDKNDNLRMGYGLNVKELRDAAQFYPIIVLNGENCTDGSYGMGIQPRTAIGQTSDKTTLMLIIDGRQTHSLGTTVSECANILLRYGCWNAMNMDGGSSSSMTYMGEMITKTSSPMKTGRYLPDAWLVKKAGE